MIEITQEQADKIMVNIDKHVDSGYGTAFDGTYEEGSSYKRLENMLAPIGVKVIIDEELTDSEKIDAFRLMQAYGGSFAKLLASSWFAADETNRAKIEEGWTELVKKYARHSRNVKTL